MTAKDFEEFFKSLSYREIAEMFISTGDFAKVYSICIDSLQIVIEGTQAGKEKELERRRLTFSQMERVVPFVAELNKRGVK